MLSITTTTDIGLPTYTLPKYFGISINTDVDMEYDKATYAKRNRKHNLQNQISTNPTEAVPDGYIIIKRT